MEANKTSRDLAYEKGWDAYWDSKTPSDNSYVDQELRDEWNCGWLIAQEASMKGY